MAFRFKDDSFSSFSFQFLRVEYPIRFFSIRNQTDKNNNNTNTKKKNKNKNNNKERKMLFRIPIILFLLTVNRCEVLLSSISRKSTKIAFVYPSGAQSERDLFVCPENAACNIIHKRFWLPALVERLCRCPRRRECTSTWSDEPDTYSIMLDNRSQMKFCSDLSDLPQCTLKKNAIQIDSKHSNSTLEQLPTVSKTKSNQKTMKQQDHRNVTVSCQCKEPHYWKQRPNATKIDEKTHLKTQYYVCSKLKKCAAHEFCGFIRTDTHSTYYRCSCPKKHMCIAKDKITFKVEEMLYNGDGYKAFCLPTNHRE